METKQSPSSLAAIHGSTTAATLSQFNATALRRDFERLSVDDLTALASFPAAPHELIGRVVAVAHCLLLSLATGHTSLELCAPPWPLLRLHLLTNTHKIWKKMRKRAWQLETRVKSLAPVQISFGWKELVPFVLPLQHAKDRYPGDYQLEPLAQVSTIAASLGAWVIFCLCCSVPPSPLPSLRCSKDLQQSTHDSDQHFVSLKPSHWNRRSPQRQPLETNARVASSTATRLEPITRVFPASRRIGVKINGRFLLLHTRYPYASTSCLGVDPIASLGEWSSFGLDVLQLGQQQPKQEPGNAAWWKPPQVIETKPLHPLALCYMPLPAQHSFLLQLASHEHIFERPRQSISNVKPLQRVSPLLTLKFDVVAIGPRSPPSVLGVGNTHITMATTVSDLRRHVTPIIASCLFHSVDKQADFHFMYRGSLLAVSQENHLAAVTLLPFAMLVMADNYHVNEYRNGNRLSNLWHQYCALSWALVNAGPPIAPVAIAPTSRSSPDFRTTLYAVHRPLPATLELIELLTHWQAFVYFQELQNSSVLVHLSPKKQPKLLQHSAKHHRSKDYEDTNDENSVFYGPQPQPLPRKKFNNKNEWLLPLYAVVKVVSSTTAVFTTPYLQYVEHMLDMPCRLVLAEEVNVVHVERINSVAIEQDDFGTIAVLDMTFLRDESCPLEQLMELRSAYVWLITPRSSHKPVNDMALPSPWMLDLHRFVQHPTFDYQGLNHQQFNCNYFRVCMPWNSAERAIEARYWSKSVDWSASVNSTDLYTTVLHQLFHALRRTHPPADGVDSVKFSKLLYETKIQPTLLGIGDATFLFERNLAPGRTHEMDVNSFVGAVEWLAQQFYSDRSPAVKMPSVGQYAMVKWQLSRRKDHLGTRDSLLSSLQRFCLETLVHLPLFTSTWHEIMDSWRIARKQQVLHEYALKYCAATRLRASWLGFVSWRSFQRWKQRMKEERLAITKLQSLVRGHKQYREYQRVRRVVIRTQLWIRARSHLRRLRADRTAFVNDMRVRLVKWTRWHLWLLGVSKRLHAEKAARRDRVREKRLRRLGGAVFPVDNSRLRLSLYRAKLRASYGVGEVANADNDDEIVAKASAERQSGSNEVYELEVVDPTRSWGQLLCVCQEQINQYIAEEVERQQLQLHLGFTTMNENQEASYGSSAMIPNNLPHGCSHKSANGSTVSTDLDVSLLALARRLFIRKDVQRRPMNLRCYSDPVDTSLGKLVFKGVIRSELSHEEESIVQFHVVRILQWTNAFKFLLYTPATSTKCRYDLDASFILSILQFSDFHLVCSRMPHGEDDDVAANKERKLDISTSDLTSKCGLLQSVHGRINCILNGRHKILAFQCIINYVLKYGVRPPSCSMMSPAVAERESEQQNALLNRERQHIVKVQARLRQHLARKARLKLAQASYSKQFDRKSGRFVYVVQRQIDTFVVLGEQKPYSLFDQDVPFPPDEWQPVLGVDNAARFFNPQRGFSSRYNDILAATAIQRWFRGKMWDGINNWKLLDIAHAVRYHAKVHKPANMTDYGQLESLKRYALHLHVLQHQYKAAQTVYEAALKLAPDDPQTLACLATLLVISCPYPVTRSWQRAMALLEHARGLVHGDLPTALYEIAHYNFRWALFLQPRNPHTIANYAVYLQCVLLDIDKAELMYHRALDIDPANELFVTNFQRLQSERAPGRMYSFAGPGKIAVARSTEIGRCGPESQWREMEDHGAQPPMPTRFFHHLRTGKCAWELPRDDVESR